MNKLPARLTDPWFEAQFYGEVKENGSYRYAHEDETPMTYAESQGLHMWCPCGFGQLDTEGNERYPLDLSLNKGRPHSVLVPFANPPCGVQLPATHGPVATDGSHPRWVVKGSSLEDLTLEPSILVGPPECWHGHIHAGEVKNA